MSEKAILHDTVRTTLDAAGIDYDVFACDETLADTAEFCAHYGFTAEETCNAIVVVLKTNPRGYVACLIRSDTKLDVNHKVSALTGVKRLSFASGDETAELTGMRIGGVTIAGLPAGIRIYVDQHVMERDRIVIGGGNRTSKVLLSPAELLKLPGARVADIAVPR